MLRVRRAIAASTFVALALPLSAGAQAPGGADPDASSPSGAAYEIPVEAGRSDAAPHRRGRQPGSRGSDSRGEGRRGEGRRGEGRGEGRRSTFRTENYFGASSTVPGLSQEARAGGERSGSGPAGSQSSGASGGDPSRGGAGRGPTGEELADSPKAVDLERRKAVLGSPADNQEPSTLGMVVMLVLVVLVALGTATIGARAARGLSH